MIVLSVVVISGILYSLNIEDLMSPSRNDNDELIINQCVRAMIIIQDSGELPCMQDRIQFSIQCEYFLWRNDFRFILFIHNFYSRYNFTSLTSMIDFPLNPLIIILPDPSS